MNTDARLARVGTRRAPVTSKDKPEHCDEPFPNQYSRHVQAHSKGQGYPTGEHHRSGGSDSIRKGRPTAPATPARGKDRGGGQDRVGYPNTRPQAQQTSGGTTSGTPRPRHGIETHATPPATSSDSYHTSELRPALRYRRRNRGRTHREPRTLEHTPESAK